MNDELVFPRLVFMQGQEYLVHDKEQYKDALAEGWSGEYQQFGFEEIVELNKESNPQDNAVVNDTDTVTDNSEFINIENGDIDDELDNSNNFNGKHKNAKNQAIR